MCNIPRLHFPFRLLSRYSVIVQCCRQKATNRFVANEFKRGMCCMMTVLTEHLQSVGEYPSNPHCLHVIQTAVCVWTSPLNCLRQADWQQKLTGPEVFSWLHGKETTAFVCVESWIIFPHLNLWVSEGSLPLVKQLNSQTDREPESVSVDTV